MYDAIIVGGGPAGLSAALILGRCRRQVLLCDTGRPRNAASRGLHGFLTRENILPEELLRIGREQLKPYGVELRCAEVVAARCLHPHFEVDLSDGNTIPARMLLLATGVVDQVPAIEGMRELWGRGVFHCPYCDGWEMRDQPLAAYGAGHAAAGLAVSLTTWSKDVVLCTDGPSQLSRMDRSWLRRHRIEVVDTQIARVEGSDGVLEGIVFADGRFLPRRGVFLSTGQHQRSPLPEQLGCAFTEKGAVQTGRLDQTNVAGVYVAGDASHDVQLAIVAAAEGARAAVAMNKALQKEEQK
ncbi:MAG: NAD(P)/FAD-dependent oxidoreductase [Bryobacteraceae bacterium]